MKSTKKSLETVAASVDKGDLGYHRFNLNFNNEQLFKLCEDQGVDSIICGNYFILHKNALTRETLTLISDQYCYKVKQETCRFIKCTLLEKHQLKIGYCETLFEMIFSEHNQIDILIKFKKMIIDIQLCWATEFLNIVYDYLKNRKTAQHTLINKEIIQVMLGNVVIHIKAATDYKIRSEQSQSNEKKDYQLRAINELKTANQLLAKLHGGRAFLSGNIVEMIMVFEYFRDIYFY